MRFVDKVVIVTGAGSGIGKATAECFAAEGAKVVAADIDGARLDALTNEFNEKGWSVIAVQGNMAKQEDCERLVETAVSNYGRLDVLVNNAGIMDRFMPVGEIDNETWNRVIGVNVTGVFFMMRCGVQVMLEHGGGVIINMSSAAGLGGGYAGAAYTASKHGVVGLTRNTAVMYARRGIRCVAICPGAVETNIGMGGTPSEAGYGVLGPLMAGIPRIGQPVELAKAVLFAASEEASFLNGAVIPVDGGWTAQG